MQLDLTWHLLRLVGVLVVKFTLLVKKFQSAQLWMKRNINYDLGSPTLDLTARLVSEIDW